MLCQFFYPDRNSSATLPYDTAAALAADGMSVDVLCGWPKEYSSAEYILAKETTQGVHIHRLRYLQPGRENRIGRLVNFFSFTFAVMLRLREIGKHRVVMVYSNPPILPATAAMANKLFGTKIIFVAYDVYPEIAVQMGSIRSGSMIDHAMQCINRTIYSKASRIIVLTDEMKRRLAELRPLKDVNRIATIPNWAHEGLASDAPDAGMRFGLSPDAFVVSYFGNMGICQEMDTLMKAMEQLKDHTNVRFLLAGHGSKMETIKTRTKDLPGVQVQAFLTDDLFEEALSISDCCIVTLESGLKGLCAPSKYYSYLQAGKPVISVTDADSYLAEEIAHEQIGFAVSIGNVSALVAGISEMAADPKGCKAMGDRAHELYRRQYDKSLGTLAYIKQCRQVLKEVDET